MVVVTDELIAAYIEGNVSVEERDAVRHYLIAHPIESDLVLTLLDDDSSYEEEAENIDLKTTIESPLGDIAYAAAGFAPKMINLPHAAPQSIQERLQDRQKRISACWEELKKGK